jgi:hypothetical protein
MALSAKGNFHLWRTGSLVRAKIFPASHIARDDRAVAGAIFRPVRFFDIEQKPRDLIEWVDVILLAIDGAWRAGFTPEQIAAGIATKQDKNKRREWPDWRTADPNKAIEHNRSRDSSERYIKQFKPGLWQA